VECLQKVLQGRVSEDSIAVRMSGVHMPEEDQVWDKIFKPCFRNWVSHSECADCALRKECILSDPMVPEGLKDLWRKEWGMKNVNQKSKESS